MANTLAGQAVRRAYAVSTNVDFETYSPRFVKVVVYIIILTFSKFLCPSFYFNEPKVERLYTNPHKKNVTHLSLQLHRAPSSVVRVSFVKRAGTYDEELCPKPVSSASVFDQSQKNSKYYVFCKWGGRKRRMNHSLFCEKHSVSLCS